MLVAPMKKTGSLVHIWIMFSLIWAVLVTYFAVQNFPYYTDAQVERITGMYKILIERERRINPEFEERYGHVTAAELAESIVREGKADGYAANILDRWKGEIDFSEIEENYRERRRQVPLLRLKCLGLAVTSWSLPVVLGFFLGWMISRNKNRGNAG